MAVFQSSSVPFAFGVPVAPSSIIWENDPPPFAFSVPAAPASIVWGDIPLPFAIGVPSSALVVTWRSAFVFPSGGHPTYRMRAYDTTLGMDVYWNSADIDIGGVDYAGPGPLVNFVVANIFGRQ
jgi:hypothetical protein